MIKESDQESINDLLKQMIQISLEDTSTENQKVR